MKKVIDYMILVLLIGPIILFSSDKSFIPSSQQVILTSNTIINNPENNKMWIPDKQQTEVALIKVFIFLKKNSNSEIAMIIKNKNKYGVQFIGKIKNNKKYIFCNFFPYKEDVKNIWKTTRILVFGGGFWYWNIEYNIEDDKCESLWINGPI